MSEATTQASPTRCVVADDHPAVLDSVRRLLEANGFHVVGTARDGASALAEIELRRPELAVLDVRMPGLSGIEVARRAARSAPGTAVCLLSSYGGRALVVEALDAGVRGYVLKEAPLEDIVRAVQVVSRGGMYVDGTLAAALAGEGEGELTSRERDVLRLLAEGLRNEEIGRRLHLSPETVKVHIAKAMRKLGAATRTQAVAAALRRGLIS